MGLKMDLHMHSTFSDGRLRPVELVKKFHDEGYALIALTDHDGIDGVKEAQIAGEALGVQVITGIEFSTKAHDGTNLHLLGYKFDLENKAMVDKLEEIKQNRYDRNVKLLEVLKKAGYPLTMDNVKQRPDQTYIGKPNIARALVEMGYASSVREVFDSEKMLASPEAKAVRKEKISTAEAIGLIRGAGGIASLAHPMKIDTYGEKGSEEFYQKLDQLLSVLKKDGLGGLECYHPSADHEQSLRLVKLAEKYKLHVTEGSDFHGD